MLKIPSLKVQSLWYARARWSLGAAIVLLLVVFYTLCYRPSTRRLAELIDQRTRQQRELDAGLSKTSILPVVKLEVERLRAELQKYKTLPRQQELAQFIKDVAQLGTQSSLKKFFLNPGVPVRGEQFSEQPMQLTFEGDFVNVYSFLRHTEELQRLTRVRGLSIRSRDRMGMVKVQLAMSIYVEAN
ncbi:type 4a pilus biogenesis protein PilO [Fontivita pretiosa]|uniref:type 4a pilus biogenesis protein PilO n=1 Tax=Fontivita pretiosa TaxID=2989684 RepID=UPI003D1757CF